MACFKIFSRTIFQQQILGIMKCSVKYNTIIATFHQIHKPVSYNLSNWNTILNHNNVRQFNKDQIHFQKVQTDAENSYAYKILRSNSTYKSTLASEISRELQINDINKEEFENTLAQHWRKETATNILKAFQKVYYYAKENNISISDTRFDNLVDGLMDRCQDLTDDELSELLIYLHKYPKPESFTSHNFHDTWSALDDICCWRLQTWPIDKILLFADHWYLLGLSKYIDYTSNAIQRLSRKVRHLSAKDLVQTLFYINIRRKPGNMFDLECQLEKCVHELSVDELAVISMGYFKTKSVIKSIYLLECMVNKVMKESTTITDVSLAAILKIIRYSPHLPLVEKLQALLTKLVPEIDRFSILCCVHIALLSTITQFFHPETLSRIAEKFVNNIAAARLKDIERLTFALTLYNFNPKTTPCIYETILNELRNPDRQTEFEKHPRSVSCCVQFLSLQQIYPHDLINKVLDPKFLNSTYGDNKRSIGREILFLDCLVDIDCAEYTGTRLSNKLRKTLVKWLTDWLPVKDQQYRLSAGDKLLLDVLETVQSVQGGKEYVHVDFILPHFKRPDIIICKNKYGEPVKINHFSKYTLGDILRPENTDELIWYAIVPGNLNSFIRDTISPLGTTSTKLRQLKQIGYIPVVVPSCENKHRTQQQKEDYIRNKIV